MFCRYWRMTPREVDDLDDATFAAFHKFMLDDLRAAAKRSR